VVKKNAKSTERHALVEQMRVEQARKERMRSLAILGGCVLIVVGLLGVAVFKYVQDQRDSERLENLAIENLGVTAAAAECDQIITKEPTGTNRSGVDGNHVDIGTPITYPDSPPAFGPHWPNFLTGTEIRNFYSPADRPELQRVVHSLEHGHTLIWYDDTITQGSTSYKDLEAIAEKYDGTTTYVNILPWKSADGPALPDGKHVVLTHWAGSGDDQKGIWEYCGKPSGAVIKDFVITYPNTDSPEPGAQ